MWAEWVLPVLGSVAFPAVVLAGPFHLLGHWLGGRGWLDKAARKQRGPARYDGLPTRGVAWVLGGGLMMDVLGITLVPLFCLFVSARGGAVHTEPVVGAVESGSLAQDAGLESGDRIVALDGVPIDDLADVQQLAFDRTDHSLDIVRDGRRGVERLRTTLRLSEPGSRSIGIFAEPMLQIRTPRPWSEVPSETLARYGGLWHALFTLPRRGPHAELASWSVLRLLPESEHTDAEQPLPQPKLAEWLSMLAGMVFAGHLLVLLYNLLPLPGTDLMQLIALVQHRKRASRPPV